MKFKRLRSLTKTQRRETLTISSKGQAAIEAVLSVSVMLLLLTVGLVLMIHGIGSLILTKWASKASHCVAQGRTKNECQSEAVRELEKSFAFRHVQVEIRPLHGVLHSEIHASLFKPKLTDYDFRRRPKPRLSLVTLEGSYDLEASEYKRDP